jgi:hypothetical protein
MASHAISNPPMICQRSNYTGHQAVVIAKSFRADQPRHRIVCRLGSKAARHRIGKPLRRSMPKARPHWNTTHPRRAASVSFGRIVLRVGWQLMPLRMQVQAGKASCCYNKALESSVHDAIEISSDSTHLLQANQRLRLDLLYRPT